MRSRFLIAAIYAALLVCPSDVLAQTASSGLPPEVASAGVTQTQWGVVRDEVRRQSTRARVSERALLAAAEATGLRFATSGRFNALSLQQAVVEALEEQADQIAELQTRLDRLTGDADPAVAALFAQARAALEAGRLREADSLLADVAVRDLAGLQAADTDGERLRLRAGETIISRGNVAYLQANYSLAAQHAARAADIVPQSARDIHWTYRTLQADALKEQGLRFDGAASLLQSVRVSQDLVLPLSQRDAFPEQWARTQNAIGVAYMMLADLGVDGAFAQAVAAYQAALEVRTRASDPKAWAETNVNLANSLIGAGARSSPAMLDRAVAGFEAALQVFTPTDAPTRWATAQNNLGLALYELGEHGRSGALEQAVRAFQAALRVRTRASDPAGWASTQNNLGLAYAALADEQGPAMLPLAIEAFENALSVRSRANAPTDWADTKINLSNAYSELGEAGVAGMQEAAVAGYLDAAQVYTRDAAPRRWALIQMNLGTSYSLLAERGDSRMLDLAVQAYESSYSVRTRSDDPFGWALTSYNLAFAYRDQGRITDARNAAQGALDVYRRLGDARRAQQTEAFLNNLNR